jgi:DNA repair photolyase
MDRHRPLPASPPFAPGTPRPNRLRESEPPALRPQRKGRGARANPTGRFERRVILPDLDAYSPESAEQTEEPTAASPAQRAIDVEAERERSGQEPESESTHPFEESALRTQTLPDPSRSAIVFNRSPDIPFDASLNPYRGCEHGCAYCYARPTHEYLGYSAGLDFETKILVKAKAPQILRKELSALRWKPQVVAISGVTDAYQPVERRLSLTRRCVEIFTEFRNPITIITKNALVTRDIDLFRELAEHDAISVSISITTLDHDLQRVLEPRASTPTQRLRAVEALAAAGIPTGVMVAPIIPGLTDSETPAILQAAAAAGAARAGHIMLRLPHGVRDLFDDWLLSHRPLRREKVLHRLEAMRGGKLNDPRFGIRMRGEGFFADQIGALFRLWARKTGLDGPQPALSTASFRRPGGTQLDLGL